MIRQTLRAVMCLASLAGVGCGDWGTAPDAVTLQVLFGTGQSAEAAHALEVAPVLRVLRGEKPVSGVAVGFLAEQGGRTAFDYVISDSKGLVSPGQWTLGPLAGEQHLVAYLDEGRVMRIPATAHPGPASNIVAQGGIRTLMVQPRSSLVVDFLVSDAHGNPVDGANVLFSSFDSHLGRTRTVTNQRGYASSDWTLPEAPGTYLLSAELESSNGAQKAVVSATVSHRPPLMTRASSGELQITRGRNALFVPRVRVVDADGRPVAGTAVLFEPIEPGRNSIVGGFAVTDQNGIAAPLDWKVPIGLSTVRARMPGHDRELRFTVIREATIFSIELEFLTAVSPDVRDAVVGAAAVWSRLIVSSSGSVQVEAPRGICSDGRSPELSRQIHDLLVFVQVAELDATGGVLAAAGPCVRRTPTLMSVIGDLILDADDLPGLTDSGRLVAVLVHEIAHVLGFGTAWQDKRLLAGAGGLDPRFTGAKAVQQWRLNTGDTNAVPVENGGGAGTRDSHWRESVMDSELMTGYLEAPGVEMPLSHLTLAAMEDLGFVIAYPLTGTITSSIRGRPSAGPADTRLGEMMINARYEMSHSGVPDISMLPIRWRNRN